MKNAIHTEHHGTSFEIVFRAGTWVEQERSEHTDLCTSQFTLWP